MATQVTITLVDFCQGQGHVTVDVSAQGAVGTRRLTYLVSDLRDPVSWNDAESIVRDLLRLHFRTLTNAQARQELQAGITITV